MTAKTVLVVAGVGVGAFVLLKLLVPPRAPTRPTGTSAAPGSSLQGLLTGLGGLFGSTSASNAKPSTYYPTVNTMDTPSQQAYAWSHGVVEQEGNQLIDLNTGNALVYGP